MNKEAKEDKDDFKDNAYYASIGRFAWWPSKKSPPRKQSKKPPSKPRTTGQRRSSPKYSKPTGEARRSKPRRRSTGRSRRASWRVRSSAPFAFISTLVEDDEPV